MRLEEALARMYIFLKQVTELKNQVSLKEKKREELYAKIENLEKQQKNDEVYLVQVDVAGIKREEESLNEQIEEVQGSISFWFMWIFCSIFLPQTDIAGIVDETARTGDKKEIKLEDALSSCIIELILFLQTLWEGVIQKSHESSDSSEERIGFTEFMRIIIGKMGKDLSLINEARASKEMDAAGSPSAYTERLVSSISANTFMADVPCSSIFATAGAQPLGSSKNSFFIDPKNPLKLYLHATKSALLQVMLIDKDKESLPLYRLEDIPSRPIVTVTLCYTASVVNAKIQEYELKFVRTPSFCEMLEAVLEYGMVRDQEDRYICYKEEGLVLKTNTRFFQEQYKSGKFSIKGIAKASVMSHAFSLAEIRSYSSSASVESLPASSGTSYNSAAAF